MEGMQRYATIAFGKEETFADLCEDLGVPVERDIADISSRVEDAAEACETQDTATVDLAMALADAGLLQCAQRVVQRHFQAPCTRTHPTNTTDSAAKCAASTIHEVSPSANQSRFCVPGQMEPVFQEGTRSAITRTIELDAEGESIRGENTVYIGRQRTPSLQDRTLPAADDSHTEEDLSERHTQSENGLETDSISSEASFDDVVAELLAQAPHSSGGRSATC